MNLRVIRIAMTTAMRRATAERGGFVVATGFYVAVVLMVGSLWRTAALSHGGHIAGYSAVSLFWYIAASEAATVSINIRLIEEIGSDIASGGVAVELLRPTSIVGVRIASEFGRALPRLAGCAIAGVALAGLVVGAPPNLGAALLALVSLVLAVACNVAAQHAFAGIAFWLRDARSAWFIYQKFVFVIGGMLLPLEALPHGMEIVARCLPFSAMAYAPGRLLSGHFEPALIGVQLAWFAALVGLAVVTFGAGERRLQVVGG